MDNRNEKLLSLIFLSYYSGERIPKGYNAIREVLEKEHIPFEFIVMDDGSKDDSYKIACDLERQHDNVRAYRLSRNYGSHYSISAPARVPCLWSTTNNSRIIRSWICIVCGNPDTK